MDGRSLKRKRSSSSLQGFQNQDTRSLNSGSDKAAYTISEPRSARGRLNTQYQYEPLPSNQHIRLCCLKRVSDGGKLKDASALQYTLETVALGDVIGRYDTLSYVWGPEIPTYKIAVNGRHLQIRRNLFEFLCRLSQDQEATTARFWADAICIDQDNAKERGHQVRIMSSIYKSSIRTRVWLQYNSPYTLPMERLLDYSWWAETIDKRYSMPWLTTMHSILHNQYWDRLWIVQEIILSQEIEIWTSTAKLAWQGFVKILDIVKQDVKEDLKSLANRGGFTMLILEQLRDVSKRFKNHTIFTLDRQRITRDNNAFSYVLRAYGECQCSAILDRVYALLGLCKDLNIEPDYTLSREALFHRVLNALPPHDIENLAGPLTKALKIPLHAQPTKSDLSNLTVPIVITHRGWVVNDKTMFRWKRGQTRWNNFRVGKLRSVTYLKSPVMAGDALYSFTGEPWQPSAPDCLAYLVVRHKKPPALRETAYSGQGEIIGLTSVCERRSEPQPTAFDLVRSQMPQVWIPWSNDWQQYGILPVRIALAGVCSFIVSHEEWPKDQHWSDRNERLDLARRQVSNAIQVESCTFFPARTMDRDELAIDSRTIEMTFTTRPSPICQQEQRSRAGHKKKKTKRER